MVMAPSKKGGRQDKKLRKEKKTQQEIIQEPVYHDEGTTCKLYTRGPAKYAAPPGQATQPFGEFIEFTFLAESMIGETDPFSPYAFGGPRSAPPYRPLHLVEQPNPADTSGWAENLRWASEQRVCFWHSLRTETWNENPEHMALLVKIRHAEVWAADELVGQLVERGHA